MRNEQQPLRPESRHVRYGRNVQALTPHLMRRHRRRRVEPGEDPITYQIPPEEADSLWASGSFSSAAWTAAPEHRAAQVRRHCVYWGWYGIRLLEENRYRR